VQVVHHREPDDGERPSSRFGDHLKSFAAFPAFWPGSTGGKPQRPRRAGHV